MTLLADAILHAGSLGGPASVYGRASMSQICAVDPTAARAAIAEPGHAVRLGTWVNRDLYGCVDDWGIWGMQQLCWAATSDVALPAHAQFLIDEFNRQVELAEREGRAYRPVPPRRGSRPSGMRVPREGFWGAFWDGVLGRR